MINFTVTANVAQEVSEPKVPICKASALPLSYGPIRQRIIAPGVYKNSAFYNSILGIFINRFSKSARIKSSILFAITKPFSLQKILYLVYTLLSTRIVVLIVFILLSIAVFLYILTASYNHI